MKTRRRVYPGRELIVVGAEGELDMSASKRAIEEIVSDPEYSECYEVIMDLRHVECHLSVSDLFELASLMAWPDAALPTRRKVAVLVSGEKDFDHAWFFELCAQNRGLPVKSFTSPDKANVWLDAELPGDLLQE